jgi:Putative zinc-finger
MLRNENTTCGFEDEIVSYIYNELPTNDRRSFESHLSGCTACTDQFADVSDARFSIFEYQKEEFAGLPTPLISIPFSSEVETVRYAADQPASGLLADIRGSLAGWQWGLAALTVLIVGSVILAGNYYRLSQRTEQPQPITVGDNRSVAQIPSPDKAIATETSTNRIDKDRHVQPVAVSVDKIRRPVSRSKQIAGHDRDVRQENDVKVVAVRSDSKTKAPALTNFEDSDDSSLRLSDLFENEVGIK